MTPPTNRPGVRLEPPYDVGRPWTIVTATDETPVSMNSALALNKIAGVVIDSYQSDVLQVVDAAKVQEVVEAGYKLSKKAIRLLGR